MRNIKRRTYKRVIQKRILGLIITTLLIVGIILVGGSVSGLAKTSSSKDVSYKYYTSVVIEKGDTLWSIAREYVTDEYDGIEEYIDELCSLNHLYDNNIYAGQYLTIPYYSTEVL